MERLGHAISRAILEGSWKPMVLGSEGPPLSHLFFTDDLVVFDEASLSNAMGMRKILEGFSTLLGNKVSSLMFKICFSSNISSQVKKQIGHVLSYQQIDDLGSYLGVSLFHLR